MLYEFDGKAPVIDPSSYVSESARLIGDVRVGARCYIGPGAVIRGDDSPIVIGDETAVEDLVVIHSGGVPETRIGRRVTIGHGALVHSTVLEDGASIGMGAVLSLFTQVGENSVVGESALVKRGQKIPPNVVVGGVPCGVIRAMEPRDLEFWALSKDHYVKLAAKYLDPGCLKRLR